MNELGGVVVIDSIYWMCGTLPKRKKKKGGGGGVVMVSKART
jgi:hypothetical protein